ncbi:GntR family transcriptional regulator [Thioclava sp.]|uniref:GntR family transcriptional regulator n=1 Tax=Thioclava sp. TaxID=1933450 RepID=UPI003AA9551F
MRQMPIPRERRTSADEVFDYLYDEIVALRMLPGAKISEVEIANKLNVSRQPVRDAFNRLTNLDLLLVRPQRATEVRRFSYEAIQAARFIRAAVEVEVIRLATQTWDGSNMSLLQDNLDQQKATLETKDGDAFHKLDYEFHRILCKIAGVAHAFKVIAEKKALVDRLCVLGLTQEDRIGVLYDDHTRIAERIAAGDAEGAVEIARLHLARLDPTIVSIRKTHGEYFEA